MGRYDKIRYWSGSSWVQPNQVKYWNGSAWVDLGLDDSDNTTTLQTYTSSGWQRVTLNKEYGDKYVLGPITRTVNNTGWGPATASRVIRYNFKGYMYALGASIITYHTKNDDCQFLVNLAANNKIAGRTYYSTYKINFYISGKTIPFNEWHYYDIQNTSWTNKNGKNWLRADVDNTGTYSATNRQLNGAIYTGCNGSCRLGGTNCYFKDSIYWRGGTQATTVNVDLGTVGQQLSVSNSGTWRSNNSTVQQEITWI